ncbi:MAG: HepT-like ribonuclease domain-containing protein, partial [Patescibacteria group bacterium]
MQLQDAVTRRLEIIGEAVKNLPTELKKKYSKVPWKKITGTRDILIHEYFGTDFDLIWEVVKRELPK